MMNIKKNYIAILLSIIINNFGDVLFDLFIVWKITEKSGNILNAVYLIGSSIIFRAILALFIGVLIDKNNKKSMIVFSNISSALIILIFALSYNFVLNNIWLGVVFILINDINNEIFSRSYITMTAELFGKETFIKFQAKYTIVNRIITIAGSSIVGFLVAYISENIIFGIDIVTFLICALLISTVNYNFKRREMKESDNQAKNIIKNIVSDLKYVFSVMFKTSFILKFILIMFILNFAYGYIPYILPVMIANNATSSVLLGFIKSAVAIGEIIGLLLVSKFGEYVSSLFKISMLGNAICMLILMVSKNYYIIILLFALYGALDSITQPLFSYTITILDENNRGKILGGIDAIILLSPSIGMYFITKIMNINIYIGYVALAIIFSIALIIVNYSKELKHIIVKKDE
ncbi:MFS transporter [Anaerocolumna xylanovorans]|uniref:Major Facilitator Superfamily protein n=1 Tax=Anaerocolumna xylanovorans DSM 12503 TaxID=1121345 RepID=A0A1M7Y5B3_9FIRM|nr:MFS transporter [Anaerocolumna xylanovorans]SHO47425.1 Major Facilitator Superfamily protein [Anaerocolumna xylanovorans DSM 12503]